MSKTIMARVVSDAVLDQAYKMICKQRINHHPNSDIWYIRFHWCEIKPTIQTQLTNGQYQFDPARVCLLNGQYINVFGSRDAIVLKAMSIVLSPHVKQRVSKRCFHVAGRGGIKRAVRSISAQCHHYEHVLKSDVFSYYGSMSHRLIMKKVSQICDDPSFLSIITAWLTHLIDYNASLSSVMRGISKGCSLSPLIGALYLTELDAMFLNFCKQHRLVYARYQDDWVCLTRTKTQLRTLIKRMYTVLQGLDITIAPAKTFFGRVSAGFDFLGYRLTDQSHRILGLAKQSIANHVTKLTTLYEQQCSPETLGNYVTRWTRWVMGGINCRVWVIGSMRA